MLLVWPRASHGRVAAATALLALATDANIEPLVRQTRLWWRWHPADEDAMPLAPWTNYATWFFAALALAWLMRERSVVPRVARRPWKPAAVLLVLNNVFLLAHLAHLLRR